MIRTVIGLSVFVIFAGHLGERRTANHLEGVGLIGLGAWFVFRGPFA